MPGRASKGRGPRRKQRIFPSTRWTLIEVLRRGDHPQHREHLTEFYQAYAPAFDVFLRVRFPGTYDEAGREDLIQDFIRDKCIGGKIFAEADPAIGSLRALLGTALVNFVIADLRKRERSYSKSYRPALGDRPALADAAPREIDVFDIAWACRVVARVNTALKSQWSDREKHLTWRVYQESLLRPMVARRAAPTCQTLAQTLKTSTATAQRHRDKARRGFRKALREILAEYVESAAELELELADLTTVIRQAPPEALHEALLTIDDAVPPPP